MKRASIVGTLRYVQFSKYRFYFDTFEFTSQFNWSIRQPNRYSSDSEKSKEKTEKTKDNTDKKEEKSEKVPKKKSEKNENEHVEIKMKFLVEKSWSADTAFHHKTIAELEAERNLEKITKKSHSENSNENSNNKKKSKEEKKKLKEEAEYSDDKKDKLNKKHRDEENSKETSEGKKDKAHKKLKNDDEEENSKENPEVKKVKSSKKHKDEENSTEISHEDTDKKLKKKHKHDNEENSTEISNDKKLSKLEKKKLENTTENSFEKHKDGKSENSLEDDKKIKKKKKKKKLIPQEISVENSTEKKNGLYKVKRIKSKDGALDVKDIPEMVPTKQRANLMKSLPSEFLHRKKFLFSNFSWIFILNSLKFSIDFLLFSKFSQYFITPIPRSTALQFTIQEFSKNFSLAHSKEENSDSSSGESPTSDSDIKLAGNNWDIPEFPPGGESPRKISGGTMELKKLRIQKKVITEFSLNFLWIFSKFSI